MDDSKEFFTGLKDRSFVWFAEYSDNMVIKEYDQNGFVSFNDINSDGLVKFGFYGMGIRIWLNTENGRICVEEYNEDKISFYSLCLKSLDENNVTRFINLFTPDDFKLIQLKHYVADFDTNTNTKQSKTDQYIFGYTSHPKYANIPMTVSCKCIIDIGNEPGIYNDIAIRFGEATEQKFILEAIDETGKVLTVSSIECDDNSLLHKSRLQLIRKQNG